MGKESAPSQPAPQHSPSLGVPNLQHCHLKLPENREPCNPKLTRMFPENCILWD